MAFIIGKGTVLAIDIATVLTTLAQVISIDLPEAETETFEADTLDNAVADIPYKPTGRTEGGSIGFELFFDPALAGHMALTDILDAPALTGGKVTFADGGTTEWPFEMAGFSLGGTIVLNDGVKATCSGKLDGCVTYP